MSKRPKSKHFVEDSTSSSEDEGSGREEKKLKVEKEKNKKEKKKKKEEKKEPQTEWALSGTRKVTVREFKGKILVDIREYYSADDGELRPGKKGISLNLDQWKKLVASADEIDAAIKNM